MRLITSGSTYIDIDAYAGCVAYAELLNLQGEKAIACSSAVLNESITKTIREWKVDFVTDYKPSENDEFVIIDVSDPSNFDKNADIGRIGEVIDHHVGFEKYWNDLIGDKSTIDFIGSVCTLIFEKYQSAGMLEKISINSARLMITGILDNTLNFKASITTERDKNAYVELSKIAILPDNWAEQYFSECQNSIVQDIDNAISNDTKKTGFKMHDIGTIFIGQLVFWDGKEILDKYLEEIKNTMLKMGSAWFVNLVSIGEGTSYFITEDDKIKDWAIKLFGVKFDATTAIVNKLWLRKEIVKKDAAA